MLQNNDRIKKIDMNRLYKIALLFTCLLIFNNAKATHMMGGDITYECISNGKYKFVIKVYRDCRGIPFNNPSISMYCVNGGNMSNNTNVS